MGKECVRGSLNVLGDKSARVKARFVAGGMGSSKFKADKRVSGYGRTESAELWI